MKKIYSTIDPSLLLHQIVRLADITNEQHELSNPKEFLQIRAMNLGRNRTFAAHKHIWKNGVDKMITQESWIIIKGQVRGVFYDTDHQIIADEVLEPGDCAITFQGGHGLTSLADNTIMYEIKTGPYQGREKDKTDIE